jgi:hypothetical protein
LFLKKLVIKVFLNKRKRKIRNKIVHKNKKLKKKKLRYKNQIRKRNKE